MANSPQEVLVDCRQHDVKAVALHVTDALGRWHQLTIPLSRLTEESFEDGFAWSLPYLGQRHGEVMDVVLIPHPSSAFIQPQADLPTLSLLCSMNDPLTREELAEDPRTIATKAEKFASDSGVSDEILLSLLLDFFLLDPSQRTPGRRGAYRQTRAPDDSLNFSSERFQREASRNIDDDFRSEVMQALSDCGISIASHRQSADDRLKSQLELSESGLVTAADQVMIAKHVVRQLAARWGKVATFMPLPQTGRQPAGMPTQLSMLHAGRCALSGSGYAGLSEAGLHAIGGILKHAAALTALTNATTNSYARLNIGPLGYRHGSGNKLPRIAYSQSDLRAALRIPSHRASKHKCLEYQLPDAVCNPYLAFSALLMAAVDGIQNKTHPGPSLDPDPYSSEQLATSFQPTPASLSESLNALEEDGEFLLRGDVFTPEFLQSWIEHKRLFDVDVLRRQPHPSEIEAYFDM